MSALDALRSQPAVRELVRTLRERPGARLELHEPYRHAAVALILRAGPHGEPELLMIKRATYESDPWSGHVALPGGRQEPDDASLEATVLRETREEIGVDLERDGCLVGSLDDVEPHTRVLPPFVISPFVVLLSHETPLVLSPEVAEAFWVPLSALLDPSARREVVLQLASGPRTVWSFQHRGYIIWGLTERILRQFLGYLEPRAS